MRSFFRAIPRYWNQFFFEPIPVSTISLFRVVFGAVVLMSFIGKFPIRDLFYSAHGLVPPETMDRYFPRSWLWFRWWPDEDPALTLYFMGMIASAFSLMIGFQTRIASVLVWASLMSMSNRNFFVENSGDDLMRINSMWLMFAPAGRAYSVDRWLRRRRGLEGAEMPREVPWAQRMLQLQLSFLYINTAYLKLPGAEWQNGTAIYYALNYIELRRFEMKPLFYYLWQIKLMTWGTVVAEFAAGILIWMRPLRYPVVLAAIGLHMGINLTMHLPTFQYVMMASLFNFLYPEDVERWGSWLVDVWRTRIRASRYSP
jgi:hypothetical protein